MITTAKVMTIYTGSALIDPIKTLSKEIIPGIVLVNILDDSLIKDVIDAGSMSQSVLNRILSYCEIGNDLNVDAVLQTCSSVGGSISLLQPFFDFPIYRIDQEMSEQAVEIGSRICVLGTLATTLDPSRRLLEQIAEKKGKPIHIVEGLAKGAFEALSAGNPDQHDSLILDTAKKIASQCDVIVLAQGSMAHMEFALVQETGLSVLSSVRSGLERLGRDLNQ